MIEVGVIGLGLIGGSLSAALSSAKRKNAPLFRVVGWDRDHAITAKAKARRIIQVSAKDFSDLSRCDIVVLCVPAQFMSRLAAQAIPFLKKGAVLTDVGSVKSGVLNEIEKVIGGRKNISFVGAHPIAGSEKSGFDHVDAHMFRHATCVIVPGRHSSRRDVAAVKKMWESVGTQCLITSATKHDEMLALTSHLPHLMSFALFKLALATSKNDSRIRKLTAGSFKDMTRVAASEPNLWAGVFKLNQSALQRLMKTFFAETNSLLNSPPAQLRKKLALLSRAKKSW